MQCQPENNLTTTPTKFSKQLDLKVLKEFHLEVILLGEGLVQPAAEILQRVFLYYLLFQPKDLKTIWHTLFPTILEKINWAKHIHIHPIPLQWCSAGSPTPWEWELPSFMSSESRGIFKQNQPEAAQGANPCSWISITDHECWLQIKFQQNIHTEFFCW